MGPPIKDKSGRSCWLMGYNRPSPRGCVCAIAICLPLQQCVSPTMGASTLCLVGWHSHWQARLCQPAVGSKYLTLSPPSLLFFHVSYLCLWLCLPETHFTNRSTQGTGTLSSLDSSSTYFNVSSHQVLIILMCFQEEYTVHPPLCHPQAAAYHQARGPEFNSQDPHGGGRPNSPQVAADFCTCALTHSCTHTHCSMCSIPKGYLVFFMIF